MIVLLVGAFLILSGVPPLQFIGVICIIYAFTRPFVRIGK